MFGFTENKSEKGFAASDRKALFCVFSIFLVIIFVCWGFMLWKHITRERDLTLDNYREYVSVSVDREVLNGQEVGVSLVVRGKKDVSDFEIVVEVDIQSYYGNGEKKTQAFEIKRDRLYKGVETKEFIVKEIGFSNKYTIRVISISGRL
ncbi:MAG: hypothetical protein IJD33_04095 [Clostridia bacterium]|nr:hypothetical protein [Clostridia bacterium]